MKKLCFIVFLITRNILASDIIQNDLDHTYDDRGEALFGYEWGTNSDTERYVVGLEIFGNKEEHTAGVKTNTLLFKVKLGVENAEGESSKIPMFSVSLIPLQLEWISKGIPKTEIPVDTQLTNSNGLIQFMALEAFREEKLGEDLGFRVKLFRIQGYAGPSDGRSGIFMEGMAGFLSAAVLNYVKKSGEENWIVASRIFEVAGEFGFKIYLKKDVFLKVSGGLEGGVGLDTLGSGGNGSGGKRDMLNGSLWAGASLNYKKKNSPYQFSFFVKRGKHGVVYSIDDSLRTNEEIEALGRGEHDLEDRGYGFLQVGIEGRF